VNLTTRVGRLVRWLADRTWSALFGLFFAWFVAWTGIAYVVLNELVSGADQEDLATLAASLMTAFGALFAFLTAFVITIEWNQRRDAEHNVGLEADACVRLAWASQYPGCDGPAILAALRSYLRSVLDDEWPALAKGAGGSPATHDQLGAVQRLIRHIAAEPALAPSVGTDLTAAVNQIAVTRADRINQASHDLPTPLFLLAFLSGIMLTLNAISVSLRFEPGFLALIGGLVMLVALDLALLVAIGSPFSGGLRVGRRPLEHVLDDLDRNRYVTG
jgi:hypothetical protein